MLTRRQGGFTLVEITIVLAITASLAAIVLTGQSTVRQNAQFSGVIDNLVSRLDQIRGNAATSQTTGAGNNQSQLVYGELVQAVPGSDHLTVYDLIGSSSSGSSLAAGNGTIDTLSMVNPRTITFNWNVKLVSITGPSGTAAAASDTYSLVYHRLIASGKLFAYAVGKNDPTALGAYTESPQATLAAGMYPVGAVTMTLVDEAGRQATITVDGLHDAAATSVVQ